MQKIIAHLWFDKEAKEAGDFYAATFGGGSKVKDTTVLHNTPSGSVDIVTFELWGQEFMAISAGPLFKFNPSVSFHVACKTKDEVDVLWKKLSEGGTVLMELDEYPFSEKYGWLQDRYGLSWQIMYVGDRVPEKKITPVLMFVGDVCGRAEEAINFYVSVFKSPFADAEAVGTKIYNILHYGKNVEPDKDGSVKYASFALHGKEFGIMDSAHKHDFAFNEAISFMVNCETQEEIDYYWEKLSADPKAEQCGWLKDKFGLSWQITSSGMGEMLKDKDQEKVARVTEAFLKMKKFDLAKLKDAYESR